MRTPGYTRWLTVSLLLVCAGSVSASEMLLSFGGLIDGTGQPLEATQILVSNKHIVAVGNDLRAEYPQAEQFDLSHLTGVPGLIDVHTHLTYGLPQPAHGNAWDVLMATSPAQRLVAAVHNAQSTLETGVTTVRDLFAFDGVDLQLKALIDAGIVAGPRVFSAGLAIHRMTVPADLNGAALAAHLEKHVEIQAASGVSWIKIFATSGSADDLSDQQQFFYPEIKAATDRAHALGLKVAVHCYGPSAVDDVLRAGVDSIEHAVGLSAEQWRQWAQTPTFYVPTIDHNRYYAEHRHEYGYDAQTADDLGAFIQRNVAAVEAAHAAGVRMAMGSDAVMSMFGQNTRELTWLAKAGLTNAEIIRVATQNGAFLLGAQDQLGRLQPGYLADIVAVRGDPLEDVSVLVSGVEWVMRNGRWFDSRP